MPSSVCHSGLVRGGEEPGRGVGVYPVALQGRATRAPNAPRSRPPVPANLSAPNTFSLILSWAGFLLSFKTGSQVLGCSDVDAHACSLPHRPEQVAEQASFLYREGASSDLKCQKSAPSHEECSC